MRRKVYLLLLFLFLIFGLKELNSQSLVIRMHDGTENSELLSTIQKLSFPDGDLQVTFKSGAIDTYGLSTLQKLYFQTATSVNEPVLTHDRIVIWPNPANETITVEGIPGHAEQLFIYSQHGYLMLTKDITSGYVILDIHRLSPGLYLLRVDGHSSKFIKQ